MQAAGLQRPLLATHIVEPVGLKSVGGAEQLVEVVSPEVVANVGEDGDPDVGLGGGMQRQTCTVTSSVRGRVASQSAC